MFSELLLFSCSKEAQLGDFVVSLHFLSSHDVLAF